jgi:hypothetical protein
LNGLMMAVICFIAMGSRGGRHFTGFKHGTST